MPLNQELYLVLHDDQSKSTIGSPQTSVVGGCHGAVSMEALRSQRQMRAEALDGPGKILIDGLKQMRHTHNVVKDLPSGLYGITSDKFGHTHPESAQIFLKAGVKIIQYCAGTSAGTPRSTRDIMDDAHAVKEMCSRYGAALVVNGRIDVALAIGADGVHLGHGDMPLTYARSIFKGTIGQSADTAEMARKAELEGADYICANSVFTPSAKSASKAIGIEGLGMIAAAVATPVYAAGGINLSTLPKLKATRHTYQRLAGFVSVSGVLSANDPIAAARNMMALWGA